jgi:WhiB family redox-sensing transcriptional regulator
MAFRHGTQHGMTSAPVTNWRLSANCRDTDPEVFFPISEGNADHVKAVNICRRCPDEIQAACLADSIKLRDFDGIRAGMTGKERRSHARRSGADLTAKPVSAAKTRCLNGHDYTPANTAYDKRGFRKCRRCHADKALTYNAMRRVRCGEAVSES